MNSAPAIELAGIDKRFGAVHANCDVSLRVAAGTVHGIVGENGACKSTLMSILYGFYEANPGETRIDGRHDTIRTQYDVHAHRCLTGPQPLKPIHTIHNPQNRST